MTVEELIEELRRHDPKARVGVRLNRPEEVEGRQTDNVRVVRDGSVSKIEVVVVGDC